MEFGVSYFGCRYPEHFENDIKKLKDNGFSRILLTYSENDYFFYTDTIYKLVDISKKYNFITYLDPWGVLGIFGGEAFSKFLLDYPEIWQIDNFNNQVGCACLTKNKTYILLKKWLHKAVQSNTDYIFWDEPHYYFKNFQKNTGIWGCSCQTCKSEFEKKFNKKFPKNITAELIQFRNSVIIKLLNKLCNIVYKHNKKNNICLLPTENTEFGGLTDWNNISRIKHLDTISTDPYWQRKNKNVKEYVGYYTDKLKNICNNYNINSEVWVQSYKIIKNKENEICDAVKILKHNNINSVMFWSYKAGYPMSFLQSYDYKKTWDIILKVVKKYG